MFIRKAAWCDLSAIENIYAEARKFMAANENPKQWGDTHPPRMLIEQDIRNGHAYICEQHSEIVAVFYFNIENDATYTKIDGTWLNDEPYGVVHRIAVKIGTKGVGRLCLKWAFEQCGNLRIDTHEANMPMLALLNKLSFIPCGTIWIENGDTRLAFHKIA